MSSQFQQGTTIRTSDRTAEQVFLLVVGDGILATHLLPETGEVVIGRGSGAGIAIEHPSISRRHAAVSNSPLAIRDLGSANGTRVRGSQLAAEQRAELSVGDSIELGDITLVVQRRSVALRPRRIWPHGFFETRLVEECARCEANKRTCAVLRIQIQDLGDDAQLVEDELARVLRPSDAIGNYAPGEYEVLVVDSEPADVEAHGREISKALAAIGILVTIGTACYPRDGRDADALLAAAATKSPARVTGGVVVADSAMKQLHSLIDRIARSDITVLVLGETGVGKEVVAEAIHRASPRADKPFLRLHCAAISETLLESELFGYERGAFTGAVATKPGLLETADGGTVLLDEVGELPLEIQVKLLRVLETREVMRVGGLKPRTVDVRFIAATNRELEREIEAGRFRSDVYYRLNGFQIVVPPLRERRSEIEPLARQFLAEAIRRTGGRAELSPPALALLQAYSWPGNIRELRNVIERASVLANGAAIQPAHLPVDKLELRAVPTRTTPPAKQEVRGDVEALRAQLAEAEKKKILDALEACGGNQSRAAKLLAMSRGALLNKLDAYGVPRPRKS